MITTILNDKTIFMKRILAMVVLTYFASCSNPEDRATGNPDGTRFNADENKVTNSRPGPTDPNSQSDAAGPDTSNIPSSSKQNVHSNTSGTNRSYGNPRDSAKH
jgi:hypothetical protein